MAYLEPRQEAAKSFLQSAVNGPNTSQNHVHQGVMFRNDGRAIHNLLHHAPSCSPISRVCRWRRGPGSPFSGGRN